MRKKYKTEAQEYKDKYNKAAAQVFYLKSMFQVILAICYDPVRADVWYASTVERIIEVAKVALDSWEPPIK